MYDHNKNLTALICSLLKLYNLDNFIVESIICKHKIKDKELQKIYSGLVKIQILI